MFASKWKLVDSWVSLEQVVRDFDITLDVLTELVKNNHVESISTDDGPRVLLDDIEDRFRRRR